MYESPMQRFRLYATTVSGHHVDTTGALLQFGHNKNDPTLRQVNLCPSAQTGRTPSEMAQWIATANAHLEALQALHITASDVSEQLLAQGCTFERQLQMATAAGSQAWTERILLVRLERLRQQQLISLNERLAQATEKLLALTPAPGRIKRQLRTEANLVTAATAILQHYEVEGWLTYTFEHQETRSVRYVRLGHGGAERPQQETVAVHYQLTTLWPTRNSTASAKGKKRSQCTIN